MRKKMWAVGIFLIFSSLTFSESKEIKEEIFKFNEEFQELQLKEAEKITELKIEKNMLEEELLLLTEKMLNKDKIISKLEKDSQIRWHRDEYKKLLKEYQKYFKKLGKKIEETEQKISELKKLLEIIE